MSDSSTQTTHLSARLSAFFLRHRTGSVAVGVLMIVAIVASVAIAQYVAGAREDAYESAEAIEELYQEYRVALQSTDTDESAETEELETSLRELLTSTIAEEGTSYAALRATYTLAELEWSKENWNEARQAFLQVADSFDSSHLTVPALMSAAASAENMGDTATSRDLFARILSIDSLPTVETPRVLINLARIAEQEGDIARAQEYYQRIVDDHATTEWSKLAQSRLIVVGPAPKTTENAD